MTLISNVSALCGTPLVAITDVYIVRPFLPVSRQKGGIDESSSHFPYKVHIVIAFLLVLSLALS